MVFKIPMVTTVTAAAAAAIVVIGRSIGIAARRSSQHVFDTMANVGMCFMRDWLTREGETRKVGWIRAEDAMNKRY